MSPLEVFNLSQMCFESLCPKATDLGDPNTANSSEIIDDLVTISNKNFSTTHLSHLPFEPSKTPHTITSYRNSQSPNHDDLINNSSTTIQTYKESLSERSPYVSSLETNQSDHRNIDLSHNPKMVIDTSINRYVYHMLTRAKTRHLPPPRKFSYVSESVIQEPTTTVEAMSKPEWFRAMQVEYEILMKNRT